MECSNDLEKEFYEELQIKVNLVQLFEDENLLNYTLELIPFEELSCKASTKQTLLEKNSITVGSDDLLIEELLNWFKHSFFQWMDVPKCKFCKKPTVHRGLVAPTKSDLEGGANKVENYFCTPCQKTIRFPRYNHPRKLLQTRIGRCGEWANTFTLMCRALGYDARMVWDWSDHVWTEVYSHTQQRWLHCDSCEGICDKPLIYEMGWKKDISYVIAFSKDEVQDVTWRYTTKYPEVLARRTKCQEPWLTACMLSFTATLQSTLMAERKEELAKRRVAELVAFLTPPQLLDGVLEGRQSGSRAWRMARGEVTVPVNPFVFTLTETELGSRYFHVKYNCASDKYIRVSDESREKLIWESCAYDHSGVFRKTETDWNNAYLARKEGFEKGLVSWKFDFKGSGLVIQSVQLNLCSTTFENGVVRWLLTPNDERRIKEYKPEDVVSLTTQDFNGCNELLITAELTGGTGSVYWQHSQLFRQQLDTLEFPFSIQIALLPENAAGSSFH